MARSKRRPIMMHALAAKVATAAANHAARYEAWYATRPTTTGPATPPSRAPTCVTPVAPPGDSGWERTTAKLNKPFQPHPAPSAIIAPMTNDGFDAVPDPIARST